MKLGHVTHLGVVLWSIRREDPSCMSVPNLKRIALFVQKLLGGSRNFDIWSRDPDPNSISTLSMKKSAQKDANTARALAVVRFGHRPPARLLARCHKPTDRTDYNTLRRS